MQESQHKFIKIDEDGFFQMEDLRVQDNSFAQTLFSNLRLTEKKAIVTSFEEKDIFVESFDAPFVVRQIHQQQIPGQWKFLMPHEFEEEFVLVGKKENEELVATNLFLDEWDRFHGFTKSGIPFVFSRAAQSDFFNQLEDFDDTGIVVGDQRYEITNWLASFEEANSESFWTQIYENEKPGWELDQVTPILKDLLPQLKIPRSKVLVLGCGSGNDAAFFAEKGHIVTGVDFSPQAIQQAKQKYGHIQDLTFIQSDLFSLPKELKGQFDLVFEHTCYCAITPERRTELAKVWKSCLRERGHLLGIFFVHPKRVGPPYGGSEWEIKQRLSKFSFRFLYWTRWQHSIERRLGSELVVYAESLSKDD